MPRLRAWAPAIALSLSAHLVLFLALVSVRAGPITILAPAHEPRAVVVTLTRPPPPPPPPPAQVIADPPPGPVKPTAALSPAPSPAPPRPLPARAAPRPRPVRTPPPPEVQTLPANPAPVVAPMATIGEAELAGALMAGTGQGARAGSGTGGGGGGSGGMTGAPCDMVRRLQDALRADPEVRAAVTRAYRAIPASGRAILVWNGDWIQDPAQTGKGLAGVRQAIALEIAFSPRDCRTRPMRGLAVIALADGPGAPRLALGGGDWRWTDLLGAR